jgi:hypothetical protein
MCAPTLHRSTVHALKSSHWLSSSHATHPGNGSNRQPSFVSHASFVHGSPSEQIARIPPPQEPLAQVSPVVHAFPSSQEELPGVLVHRSETGSQRSSVQASPSSQSESVAHGRQSGTGPCRQHPDGVSHASLVHPFPSSQSASDRQGVPTSPWMHPMAGSHESWVHGSPSSQSTSAWEHFPEAKSQVSDEHGFLSSQSLSAPHSLHVGRCWHPIGGVHVSVVQGSPSTHGSGECWHVEPVEPGVATQLSTVHGLSSSHSVSEAQGPQSGILMCLQTPIAGSQESALQGSLSSQSSGPGTHCVSVHSPLPRVILQKAGAHRSPV